MVNIPYLTMKEMKRAFGQAEKQKNKETIEDAEAAQTAVGQALAVLKDFYKKAATATAFNPTMLTKRVLPHRYFVN